MKETTKYSQIIIRVTPAEKLEIERRAKRANLSVNQYLKDSAMGVEHINNNMKADLMKHLIDLQLHVQTDQRIEELKDHISETHIKIMRSMEEW